MDIRWTRLNEVIWGLDVAGVSDDRSLVPQEYDSLTDRLYWGLRSGGNAVEAVAALSKILRADWGVALSSKVRAALVESVYAAWEPESTASEQG